MIAPVVRAMQEIEAKRQLDQAADTKRFEALKAANDNLVSEATALRAQLKAVNDNYVDLRHEVEELKRKSFR